MPPKPSTESPSQSIGPRLGGAPNFRDFGAGKTAKGRPLRSGCLFRSEHLVTLSDADLEGVAELDFQLVCDLRSKGERDRHPGRWARGSHPERLALDMMADLRAGHASLRDLIAVDPSPAGAHRVMIEIYRTLPTNSVAGLKVLLARLADGVSPVLIHCTAGKDRTGFVASCVLSALGVSMEDVVADYLLSRERIDMAALNVTTTEIFRGILGRELSPESMAVINDVRPEYLEGAYRSLAEEFGSFDGYLAFLGVDAAARSRMQGHFLDP